MLGTYWFLFFVEFPRYYLLEVLIALWQRLWYPQRLRRRRRQQEARYLLFTENPLVTILAPGKNEGAHIYKLVKSLAEQTYRNYEIIVVDDGSDDHTPLICADLERAGLIHLFLRCHVRGGKASAANYGAHYARGKYIVHLDADSSLDRDALEKILLPFYYSPRIKAVGGAVKVRNANESVCTSMQALEYLKTIQVGRMVTNTLGIYHIISGAFGAFEADTLRRVGYWDIGPGLDGDITQKIRKSGCRVWFAEDAICMTNVPVKWSVLFKQRRRWSKSLVRFRLRKHLDILLPTRNFSWLNWLSNLECLLFDFVFNFVWLFYVINLAISFPARLPEIMVVGYIIRLTFAVVAFGVILLVSERPRQELHLMRYLWLSTFYTGYFLRMCRLLAHTEELFFFTSYRDSWNPRKTSSIARVEHI